MHQSILAKNKRLLIALIKQLNLMQTTLLPIIVKEIPYMILAKRTRLLTVLIKPLNLIQATLLPILIKESY